jgi:hypothetical protein
MRFRRDVIREIPFILVLTPGVDRNTGILSMVDTRCIRYQDIESFLRDATLDQRIPQHLVFAGGA